MKIEIMKDNACDYNANLRSQAAFLIIFLLDQNVNFVNYSPVIYSDTVVPLNALQV